MSFRGAVFVTVPFFVCDVAFGGESLYLNCAFLICLDVSLPNIRVGTHH